MTQPLVDRMNAEMDKNESLRTFLLGIYNIQTKLGKPAARQALIQNGTNKTDLNRLVRNGFLVESFARHTSTGALMTCVGLPSNIIFYNRQAIEVVQEAPNIEEDTTDAELTKVVDSISADTQALLDRRVVGD